MAQEQLEQEQGSEKQDSGQENGSGDGGHSGALKTAAAASVAAGVSYLVAKRAFNSSGGGEPDSSTGGERQQEPESGNGKASRKSDPLRSAVDVLTWDHAQEVLLPMAEKAAGAAGNFVAREAPEVVSERLVPRFIEAFNKARKGGD